MSFDFGDVVLVPFPFTNQAASKKRPAVIVNNRAYNAARPDIVVMAITSQLRPVPALGEVWFDAWQAAGLLKPSAVSRSSRHWSNRSCFALSASWARKTKLR